MSENMLSSIFERSLSLDQKIVQNSDRAMTLWERMASSLDNIAANTSGGIARGGAIAARPARASTTTKQGGGEIDSGPLLAAMRHIRNVAASMDKQAKDTAQHTQKVAKKRKAATTKQEPVERQAVRQKETAAVATPTATARRKAPATKQEAAREKPVKRSNVAVAKEATEAPRKSAPAKSTADKSAPTKAPKEAQGGASQEATGKPASAAGETSKSAAVAQATSLQKDMERASDKQAGLLSRTMSDGLHRLSALMDRGKDAVKEESDAKDAAGYALGGPIWGALKEIHDAIPDSLKERLYERKERLKQTRELSEAVSKGPARDEKGRFASENPNLIRRDNALQDVAEAELALEERAARVEKKHHKELIKAVKDNHRSLLDRFLDARMFGRAARPGIGIGGKGKGCCCDAVDFDRKKKGKGRDVDVDVDRDGKRKDGKGRDVDLDVDRDKRRGDVDTDRKGRDIDIDGKNKGKMPDKPARRGLFSRFGRGAGKGAALLGGGALAVGGGVALSQGAAHAAPAVAPNVARNVAPVATPLATAGAGGAVAAKGGVGIAAKAAGGAARAIPIIGQVLAVGLAAYDAYEGWNDTDMHKKAFNLKDGQEATTGQKTSAAVASVLDMGGLTTGLLNLMGVDIDTADIAGKMYDWGVAIGDATSDFMQQCSVLWPQVWDGVKNLSAATWDGAVNLGKSLWDGSKELGSKLLEGATVLKDQVFNIGKDLYAKGVELLPMLGETLSGLGSKILEGASWAKDQICNIGSSLLSEAQKLLPELIPSLSAIGTKIAEGATFVKDKILDIGTCVWDKMQEVLPSLTETLGSIGGKIAEGAIALKDKIFDVGNCIWAKGQEMLPGLGESLAGIGAKISEGAEVVKTTLFDMATSLKDMGTKLLAAGGEMWDKGTKAVSDYSDSVAKRSDGSTMGKLGVVASDAGNALWDSAKWLYKNTIGPSEVQAATLDNKVTEAKPDTAKPVADVDKASAAKANDEAAKAEAEANAPKPAVAQSTAQEAEKSAPLIPESQKAAIPNSPKPARSEDALPPAAATPHQHGAATDTATGGGAVAKSTVAMQSLVAGSEQNNREMEDLNETTARVLVEMEAQTKLLREEQQARLFGDDKLGLKGVMQDAISSIAGAQRSYSSGYSGGGGSSNSNAAVSKYDPNNKLGDTIARFESGKDGINSVSYDRVGGTSYGKFQLASKTGSFEDWLRLLEKKGGESAEIAKRLRAAGPANTGSAHGAVVDAYRREVQANPQLIEETQRESLMKNNYNPAYKKLQSDSLRSMIDGDRSLQEMLFSTAVQHGGGGAGKIFNRAYKDGMSREELIRAVYAIRGTQFGSSTKQTRQAVQNRFVEEQALILGMKSGEENVKKARERLASGGSETLNAATSTMIAGVTQDAIDRGVTYKWDGKNSALGGVDCSGWVQEMGRAYMAQTNKQMGAEVYDQRALGLFKNVRNAADIIRGVSEYNQKLYTADEMTPDKIKEGMLIGMDTGPKGKNDAGRYKGIDHIVQTFRDPVTGEMMVSESRGSGKGVMKSRYSDWYAQQQKRGTRLYGASVPEMADASKVKPITAETANKAEQQPAQPVAEAQDAQARQAAQPAVSAEELASKQQKAADTKKEADAANAKAAEAKAAREKAAEAVKAAEARSNEADTRVREAAKKLPPGGGGRAWAGTSEGSAYDCAVEDSSEAGEELEKAKAEEAKAVAALEAADKEAAEKTATAQSAEKDLQAAGTTPAEQAQGGATPTPPAVTAEDLTAKREKLAKAKAAADEAKKKTADAKAKETQAADATKKAEAEATQKIDKATGLEDVAAEDAKRSQELKEYYKNNPEAVERFKQRGKKDPLDFYAYDMDGSEEAADSALFAAEARNVANEAAKKHTDAKAIEAQAAEQRKAAEEEEAKKVAEAQAAEKELQEAEAQAANATNAGLFETYKSQSSAEATSAAPQQQAAATATPAASSSASPTPPPVNASVASAPVAPKPLSNSASTATPTRQPAKVESVRAIDPARDTARASGSGDNSALLAMLGKILAAIETGNSLSAKNGKEGGSGNGKGASIPMDFDDPSSQSFSKDNASKGADYAA